MIAYLADRVNATTASCEMSGHGLRGSIKVTFCAVPPPRVSYYCVHATAYAHTDFRSQPQILAAETDGGLALLCIFIGVSSSDFFRPRCRHFFVYDSGTERRPPSLHHLPHPGNTFECNGPSLAIVRTHAPGQQQDHHDYVIVAKDDNFGYESPSFLCMYHSETERWSWKPVAAPAPHRSHMTNKAITIGGEVAWVDLWRNIIFCDVLAEAPKLRVLSLPPPIRPMEKPTDSTSVRDVAILDGFINYVELHYRRDDAGAIDGWMAAKWSMKITSPLTEEWHLDYEVDSSTISGSSKLQLDAQAAGTTFQRLLIGLPNLSLGHHDIVYFLARVDFLNIEQTSWVLTVDFRNNTIHEVNEYTAMHTLGLAVGYRASRISKYLKGAPAT